MRVVNNMDDQNQQGNEQSEQKEHEEQQEQMKPAKKYLRIKPFAFIMLMFLSSLSISFYQVVHVRAV